ncbi:MAG: hypothetical protein IJ489_02605 [Clostridia bacterium]|nr:hypothetical protein [Clostridia bacterium]
MKMAKIITAIALFLGLILVGVACSASDKVETQVYDYLDKKYDGLKFEIKGYTQDKSMSGRYEVEVLCKETGVSFMVYHTPIMTTDSYAVAQANAYMDDDLHEILGAAWDLANVEFIQWQDHFAEESTGYKFREVDMAGIPYNPYNLTEIYRVKLKDIKNPNDAAQCVDMVITVLNTKGISLEKITFEFVLGEDTILFTTDTDTVLGTTYDILEILFTRVNSNEDEGNLFYRNPDSKAKIIEYFKP